MKWKCLNVFIPALLLLALVPTGCSTSSKGSAVPLLPVVGAGNASKAIARGTSMTASKSIAVASSFNNINTVANTIVVPIIIGWKSNTSGVGDGGTIATTDNFGNTVTMTVSSSGNDDMFVGKWNNEIPSNGTGSFTITHHKDAGTFDFQQSVIYTVADTSTGSTVNYTIMSVATMSGTISTDGTSFKATGTCNECLYSISNALYIGGKFDMVSQSGGNTIAVLAAYAIGGSQPAQAPTYATSLAGTATIPTNFNGGTYNVGSLPPYVACPNYANGTWDLSMDTQAATSQSDLTTRLNAIDAFFTPLWGSSSF